MTQVSPSYTSSTTSGAAMSQDIKNSMKRVFSLECATRTATSSGGWVDLAGFDGAAMVFQFGEHGDTLSGTVSMACSLQESSDGITSVGTVSAANLIGTAKTVTANSDCPGTYTIGYRGTYRYIRAVLTFAGSHATGTSCSAVAELAPTRHGPPSSDGTPLATGS
jgi:hypothetical protein